MRPPRRGMYLCIGLLYALLIAGAFWLAVGRTLDWGAGAWAVFSCGVLVTVYAVLFVTASRSRARTLEIFAGGPAQPVDPEKLRAQRQILSAQLVVAAARAGGGSACTIEILPGSLPRASRVRGGGGEEPLTVGFEVLDDAVARFRTLAGLSAYGPCGAGRGTASFDVGGVQVAVAIAVAPRADGGQTISLTF